MAQHIVIVEDDSVTRKRLAASLRQQMYRVSEAENAAQMEAIIARDPADLLLVDINMEGKDGLTITREQRSLSKVGIILLTSRDDQIDRIIGLEMGADDYVTKPFNPRELLARIKTVLRRTHSLPPRSTPVETGRIRFDKWTLDVDQREAIGEDGVAIPLSTAEFHLLTTFLDHPKMVLSRDQLLDFTSGRSAKVFDRAIDNQISRLRKKLEDDPKNPTLIKTVWGGGYMLAADVDKS